MAKRKSNELSIELGIKLGIELCSVDTVVKKIKLCTAEDQKNVSTQTEENLDESDLTRAKAIVSAEASTSTHQSMLQTSTTVNMVYNWKPTKITPQGPDGRQIYFIRHGDYNKHSPNQELTPKGKLQSRSCGTYFQKTEFAPTEVVSSMLPRSIETAQILCDFISPRSMTRSDLLNEVGLTHENKFMKVCMVQLPLCFIIMYVQESQQSRAEDAYQDFIDCTYKDNNRISVYVIHRNLILYFLSR